MSGGGGRSSTSARCVPICRAHDQPGFLAPPCTLCCSPCMIALAPAFAGRQAGQRHVHRQPRQPHLLVHAGHQHVALRRRADSAQHTRRIAAPATGPGTAIRAIAAPAGYGMRPRSAFTSGLLGGLLGAGIGGMLFGHAVLRRHAWRRRLPGPAAAAVPALSDRELDLPALLRRQPGRGGWRHVRPHGARGPASGRRAPGRPASSAAAAALAPRGRSRWRLPGLPGVRRASAQHTGRLVRARSGRARHG